jgi:hypothetical protein
LTGVEGDVFLDHEGNLLSVDDDYSHTEESHELVKQAFISRIDREEREGYQE